MKKEKKNYIEKRGLTDMIGAKMRVKTYKNPIKTCANRIHRSLTDNQDVIFISILRLVCQSYALTTIFLCSTTGFHSRASC